MPGYLNVAAAFYKEWNHNGIVELQGAPPGTSTYVDYAATVAFEAQYMQPLTFTDIPLKFSGNTNVTMPKGSDGFGHQTITELLTDNRLTLDLGTLVADKPNLFDVFVGYRYWLNKLGDTPLAIVPSGPDVKVLIDSGVIKNPLSYPERVEPIAATAQTNTVFDKSARRIEQTCGLDVLVCGHLFLSCAASAAPRAKRDLSSASEGPTPRML